MIICMDLHGIIEAPRNVILISNHPLMSDGKGTVTNSPVHLQFFLSTRPNRNINYRNPTTSYETVTVL